MKAKFFLFIMLAGIASLNISASGFIPANKEQQDTYWNAVKLYEYEEYSKAVVLFQHLLEKNSDNTELNFYAGMCYYSLNKTKLARWHFSIAATDNYCRLKILVLSKMKGGEADLLTYNE